MNPPSNLAESANLSFLEASGDSIEGSNGALTEPYATRSCSDLTYRRLVLMSGTTNLSTPGFIAWSSGARSRAEPLLNFWVSKLLGHGRRVRCTVAMLDDATGAVAATLTFPLSELSITPLDVVYGVEPAAGPTHPVRGPGALEQRILFHARHRQRGFAADATIRLQHARPADLAFGEITLLDLLERARGIRQLLTRARGADTGDLVPARSGGGNVDLAELESRVAQCENGLLAAHRGLSKLVARSATATASAVRSALLKLDAHGVSSAVPVIAAGDDPATIAALTEQSRLVLASSERRVDRVKALRAAPPANEPRARRDQLIERMRAVLGESFVVLPRFTCDPVAAAELSKALASSVRGEAGGGVTRPLAESDAREGELSLDRGARRMVGTLVQSIGTLSPSGILAGLWIDERPESAAEWTFDAVTRPVSVSDRFESRARV